MWWAPLFMGAPSHGGVSFGGVHRVEYTHQRCELCPSVCLNFERLDDLLHVVPGCVWVIVERDEIVHWIVRMRVTREQIRKETMDDSTHPSNLWVSRDIKPSPWSGKRFC